MKKTLLLASAAALALGVSSVAQAAQPAIHAAGVRGTATPIHSVVPGLTTLYDQNFASGSYGFFSQTLSSYPQYDEYLADDFTVPAGHTWKVKEVDATGFYYIEYGPASSVNVLFWKDKGGLPGSTPMVECDNITPKGGLSTGVFQIKLPKSCSVKLKGGTKGKTYAVTVQANMQGAFSSGYWAWSTNNTINGSQGAGYWYGGSVTTNDPRCATQFESMSDCTGFTVDLAFALLGTDS